MAISPATITRSSVLAGLNNNQRGGSAYCATCGRAAQATQSAFSGAYSGRESARAGDSYVCATCNGGGSPFGNTVRSADTTSTYGRSSSATSSYCPSCNASQSASTAPHWSGRMAASPSQTTAAYGGLSWVR